MAATPEPRRTVYLVASLSGLRRSELKKLQKCDCSPTGDNPRWHARPVVTKNKQPINLPMLADCAGAIRPLWEKAQSPGELLFPRMPRIATLHTDLARAGINRRDENGRWADFHSFRYFFCKQMGQILPIQKVKVLMRHATLKLTADLYGELGMADVAEDVWTLPSLFPQIALQTALPSST
jgi:integrase